MKIENIIRSNTLKYLKLNEGLPKKILNLFVLSAFLICQITPSFSMDFSEDEDRITTVSVRNPNITEPFEDLSLDDTCLTLPNWASIAGISFLGLSQPIYIKWALSHLSPIDLAVAELKGPSQDLFYMIGVGPLNAIEDLIAHERGHLKRARLSQDELAIESHKNKIGEIYRTANSIGMLSSLPLIFAVRLFAPNMIRLGHDKELYDKIGAFYNPYSFLAPLFNFSFIANNFTIAEGDTRNALKMAAVTLMMCSIDYAFISGPLRFKNIFEGLAISEVTKTLIYSLGFFLILSKSPRYKKYNLHDITFNKKIAIDIVRSSIPIFLQKFFVGLQPVILMQFILPDDANLLAANGLFSQFFFIGQIFEQAIGKWLNLALKSPFDEHDFNTVISLGKRGFLHSQIIVGIFTGVVLIWPEFVASFFINTQAPENLEMVKIYLSVINIKLADFILSTFGDITSSALRGVGKMKDVFICNMFTSYGISLPLTYFFVNYCDYGLWGAIFGSLLGNAVNTCYLQYTWWSEAFQKNTGSFFKDHFWGTAEQPSTCGQIFNYCSSVFFRVLGGEQ